MDSVAALGRAFLTNFYWEAWEERAFLSTQKATLHGVSNHGAGVNPAWLMREVVGLEFCGMYKDFPFF